MSKRRLSKQQTIRIEKQHQHYRQLTETERDDGTADGLVITRHSRHAHIEDSHGTPIHCSIRPSIDSLVAGDRVVWQAEDPGVGVILSRYPRQSTLGRPEQNGKIKAIAANMSQLIIVVSPKPEISWMLLDSYLVMAETLHLTAVIILNKNDLPCDDLKHILLQIYEPLGYPLLFTSVHDEHHKPLQNILHDKVSVFVGQSGVGKSSLLAQLLPDEPNIRTAAISAQSQFGCHTTSNSRLYHLSTGGDLIDSPGVREFGLWHMPADKIAAGYREFRPYMTHCKFRNCQHRENDPGCAILDAVKNKLIAYQRYENYVKITQQF